MINRSTDFNLGADTTRMKDPNDAKRQSKTVDEILNRFFNKNVKNRYGLQILADEVGMGKTFVALAVAYSVLKAMREGRPDRDLDGCYRRVLIITPPNNALFTKWQQEVSEFVKRCVSHDKSIEASNWFKPVAVRRIDKLSELLHTPGRAPLVLVTTMRLFAGSRLKHYDLKRRFMLGVLFRHWSNRFNIASRKKLLKLLPNDWPTNPYALTKRTKKERGQLPFSEQKILDAIWEIDNYEMTPIRGLNHCDDILQVCRDINKPYQRDRQNLSDKLMSMLTTLYKEVSGRLLRKAFPLVIVDEAHNWKNGPLYGTNGYREFSRIIACRTRRALLLTATPFQLRPNEMLEILKVSDDLRCSPSKKESISRQELLRDFREQTIRKTLDNSAKASIRFAKEWTKLPKSVTEKKVLSLWQSVDYNKARNRLLNIANKVGEVNKHNLSDIIDKTVSATDPDVRPFLREALRIYTFNADLSQELGTLVIRHRRHTDHRLCRIGSEFEADIVDISKRLDSHLLHGAPGLDVKGDGELPHYLLMRCVTEMKKARGRRGRSSLGSSLTGCYSTLLESSEGHNVQKWLERAPNGKKYLDLLMDMVTKDQDPFHPKIQSVVNNAVENWRRGEKTLIFCFRVNTAKRLREIIDDRIRAEMEKRFEKCLGGGEKLDTLRKRLTGRRRDLIPIAMDRVLWSYLYQFAKGKQRPFHPSALRLQKSDFTALAELALCCNADISGARADRVFISRAVENTVAKRLLTKFQPTGELKSLLQAIADINWVTNPYGIEHKQDDESDERPEFDERGIHTVYELQSEPDTVEIKRYAKRLLETRRLARKGKGTALTDAYFEYPNLWLGNRPQDVFSGINNKLLRKLHRHLWALTISSDGSFDWESRRKIFQALRKAVFRKSVMLRMLPSESDLEEAAWGDLLVNMYLSPLPGQAESMAHRIAVFLEDLESAGGTLSPEFREEGGMRYAFIESTRLSDRQLVALVSGSGGGNKTETRDRIFTGFNTPLFPEVLVCTQVGQEGIDLHRHCRHVVHYDLAWNPAVLEQRTGRTDRIGSKTFRERDLRKDEAQIFLEVGVPFLAGTYDERMYEELRLRAQIFEVLTGGDFAAENAEGLDDVKSAEGSEKVMKLSPLPSEMVKELRVNLQVWQNAN